MTTNFNKFKNTKINDTNNLGYALTTTGNIICNGTSNTNGNMNVTGLASFIGNSNVLPSTNTGGNSGLSIYWNLNTGTGETCLLNMGQGGPGAFSWYSSNYLNAPKKLMYLDYNCNLSNLNNVSCVSVTSTGGITNSNAAITNNSTLSQVGAATFNSLSASSINNSGTLNVSGTSNLTGILYTANGITNSNAAIVNNSTLTQVGTSVFADVVRVSPGKSLYISDNTFTNYLRMYHTGIGGNSIIDFTGNFSIRNGIPSTSITTPFTINGGTNQGTFSSNLNTSGITNSTNAITNNSTLAQVGTSAFTGLITSTGGITNSNAAITNNSTLSQVGTSAFTGLITSTGGITNNGVLTQNSTCNINSALNVSGLPKFDGATNQTLPLTNTGGNAGLAIYWNSSNIGQGETCFLNMAQGGVGGFSFYSSTASSTGGAPRKLMYLDSASNLSNLNNISCNTLTASVLSLSSGTDISSRNITATGTLSGGSISTTGTLNCGALTCSSITNTSNAYDSLYRNNIKCHTVKGYSFKNTPTNVTNVFSVYPGNITSNSNTLSLLVDDTCWSISILYNYYTTFSSNTNLYQGTTQFMIMKYGNGSWITMTASLAGSSNYQPASFSISEGVLTISHAQAAITDLTIYMFYKIEMY